MNIYFIKRFERYVKNPKKIEIIADWKRQIVCEQKILNDKILKIM